MPLTPPKSLSRRTVLAGVGAAAAVAAAPLNALAGLMPSGTFSDAVSLRKHRRSDHLGSFLCERVHSEIATHLDHVIADPAINGERTALALMEARCPGCRERVHPAKSSLSAVVPQWKTQGPSNLVANVQPAMRGA